MTVTINFLCSSVSKLKNFPSLVSSILFSSSEIAYDRFKINFRNDRVGRPGGVVIVHIKDSIYGKKKMQ
jgi:hypothetical protein